MTSRDRDGTLVEDEATLSVSSACPSTSVFKSHFTARRNELKLRGRKAALDCVSLPSEGSTATLDGGCRALTGEVSPGFKRCCERTDLTCRARCVGVCFPSTLLVLLTGGVL